MAYFGEKRLTSMDDDNERIGKALGIVEQNGEDSLISVAPKTRVHWQNLEGNRK